MTIPKIFCQALKDPHDRAVLKLWGSRINSSWEYNTFNNDEQRQYIVDNPIGGLDNLLTVYDSFKLGVSKSDIFRFVYIYINGGVYFDSDCMSYVHLNDYIEDYDCVVVNNFEFLENNTLGLPIFGPFTLMGLIAFNAKHGIVYQLLKEFNNGSQEDLDTCYMHFGKKLYEIVQNEKHKYKIKFLEEFHYDDEAITKDADGTNIIKHYWRHRKINVNDFG